MTSQISETKRSALLMLAAKRYNVPKFAKCAHLDLTTLPNAMVCVMKSPMILTTVANAAKGSPDEWAMMFVGNVHKVAKCMRIVQIGRIVIHMEYENEKTWRADEGVAVLKWVRNPDQAPLFDLPCYSIDFVNNYAVNIKTHIGVRSLGLTDVVCRSAVVKQFKGKHDAPSRWK